MFTKRKSLLLGFLAAATASGLALGVNGVVDAYVGEPVEVSAASSVAKFSSNDVVSDNTYKAYSNDDWGITFGGNNYSIGTNSNNRSKCNLTSYSQYVVADFISSSSTAAGFYNKLPLENISSIDVSYDGGKNFERALGYLVHSDDNQLFTLVDLSASGFQQGGTLGSAKQVYSFDFSTSLSGYFALIFFDSGSSKDFRIDNVVAEFNGDPIGGDPVLATGIEVVSSADSVLKGRTLQFEANITPTDVTNSEVEWSVSPSDLASIDQDGLLKGLAEGVVTVTATAQDGSGVSGSKTITILPNNSELHYFGEHSNFETWGTSYTEHTLQYDKFSIKFAGANKQGSGQAITDCPVSKGKSATLTAKDGYLIKSVEFGFKQWTTKTQTTDLLVSNDGISFGNAVASIDFPSDGTSISYADEAGFKAVKVSHSNPDNQIGWEYVALELVEDTGASDFANAFLGQELCDDGLTAPSVETWNTLAASFNDISAASKETFKTAVANVSGTEIQQCVARYDYIVGKYGTEKYNDFMGRNPAQIASALSIHNSDDVMDIAVISALAIAGIAAAGAFVFLRRKKEA